MTETAESLKKNGGVDLTKLKVGTTILVETTAGVYEIEVIEPLTGEVSVKATMSPFTAQKPTLTLLERSIWDDKGNITIPFWIGKSMRMVFRDDEGKLFATHSVMSAKVESRDGDWTWEVWEDKS